MEKEELKEKLDELLDDMMKNSRKSRAESKIGEANAYFDCANKLAAILIEVENSND